MKDGRILQVVGTLNNGGIASSVLNLSDSLSKEMKINVDFVICEEPTKEVEEKIKSIGGRFFLINPFKKIGPIKYIKRLREIIRNNGPYVAVHAHTAYLISYTLKAARLEGINLRIGHAHGAKSVNDVKIVNIVVSLFMSIFRYKNRKECTHMLACMEESGKFCFGKDYRIFSNSIDIYDYINAEPISKKSLNILESNKVIGYVGMLEKVKNPLFLVDLLDELLKVDLDICLVILGRGSMQDELVKKFKEKGIYDKVRILGYRNDVKNIMKIFDYLVMPSFSEGQPMALLEAQASGVNCIVSNKVNSKNDIGLNLMTFCDLNNLKEWVDALSKSKTIKKDKEILEAFYKKGVTKNKNIEILQEIYGA